MRRVRNACTAKGLLDWPPDCTVLDVNSASLTISWRPIRRLVFVLVVAFLATVAFEGAFLARVFHGPPWTSERYHWPRIFLDGSGHLDGSIMLSAFTVDFLKLLLPLGLLALVRPRGRRRWLACLLGAALLGLLLDQLWIAQSGLLQLRVGHMDYSNALYCLERSNWIRYRFYGWTYFPILILSLSWTWCALLWNWLSERDRSPAWSCLLFALPLLISVIQEVITGIRFEWPVTRYNFFVFPHLCLGGALVLNLRLARAGALTRWGAGRELPLPEEDLYPEPSPGPLDADLAPEQGPALVEER